MNIMSTEKRSYTLKARAARQADTRRRIVEATAALHEEVGPAHTTVVQIARRAGVQRLTVYNNFPNDADLFAACGDHWLATHPPPDPASTLAIGDPAERLRAVLESFYFWYRENAQANINFQRDRLTIPALDEAMRLRMDMAVANLVDTLAAGFAAGGPATQRLRASLALALDFWTWRRLVQEGLSDDAAADVMLALVRAVAAG